MEGRTSFQRCPLRSFLVPYRLDILPDVEFCVQIGGDRCRCRNGRGRSCCQIVPSAHCCPLLHPWGLLIRFDSCSAARDTVRRRKAYRAPSHTPSLTHRSLFLIAFPMLFLACSQEHQTQDREKDGYQDSKKKSGHGCGGLLRVA